MALANKPDGQVFGSNAKHGEVVQFPDLLRGWGIAFEQTNGIPSMEHFNYLFRRLDENQLYQLQRGIGEWQSTLDYPKHALVQQEGVIYIAKLANKNKEVSSSEHWQQFGLTKADLDELLNKKADKHSPAFTGTPTAPTPAQSTNNGQIATTEFVKTAIAKLVGSAPAELDTLEELAALLAENGDLRRTLLQKIGEKAPLAHKHTTADIEGLNDALDEAGKKGVPVGAVVAFPNAVANPVGFLKCDGTTFTQSLYPDLYKVLGNQNKLPDLTRSDVGMTAYFATDSIPQGWIAFDQIRTQVTQSAYPELYRHLVAKYGSIASVPLAEDRFIRNAHGGLTVGQTQEDEIKRHAHAQTLTSDLRNDTGTTPYFDFLAEADRIAKNTQYYDERPDNNIWMMPKLTSLFATGDSETRPKSLALKLCIKARNSLDDVQFWIKAFGSIDNQGLMDASQIAITLQGKADLGHTHQYTEITDFSAGVAAAFSQNLAENGWCKLPNGLIMQWGKVNKGWSSGSDKRIVFPIAFPRQCLFVGLTEFTFEWTFTTSIQSRAKMTNSYVEIVSQRDNSNFLAIGY